MALQEAEDREHVAEVLVPEYEVVLRGWVAIASRRPVGAVRELELPAMPRSAGFTAGTLLVEVDAPTPLLLVNHFPPWDPDHEAEREAHTVAAARFVEEVAGGRHVVLAGDLDATPDAASIRFLRGRQSLDGFSVRYWDAWEVAGPDDPGHTFTPRNPLVMEKATSRARSRAGSTTCSSAPAPAGRRSTSPTAGSVRRAGGRGVGKRPLRRRGGSLCQWVGRPAGAVTGNEPSR